MQQLDDTPALFPGAKHSLPLQSRTDLDGPLRRHVYEITKFLGAIHELPADEQQRLWSPCHDVSLAAINTRQLRRCSSPYWRPFCEKLPQPRLEDYCASLLQGQNVLQPLLRALWPILPDAQLDSARQPGNHNGWHRCITPVHIVDAEHGQLDSRLAAIMTLDMLRGLAGKLVGLAAGQCVYWPVSADVHRRLYQLELAAWTSFARVPHAES